MWSSLVLAGWLGEQQEEEVAWAKSEEAKAAASGAATGCVLRL
jgi:hypothetical protein